MMNYPGLFFIDILVLCSCAQPSDLVGDYETDKYGKFEMLLKNFPSRTGFVMGASLQLRNDSTFVYQTCPNIMEGNWYVQNDSLVLYVISNRWKTDSLRANGYYGTWPKGDFREWFRITHKGLTQTFKNDPATKGKYDTFLRLRKTR